MTDAERQAVLAEYLEGTLSAERAAEVEDLVASDPAWQAALEQREDATRDALSGLQRARAPETFDHAVTATIHQRSAGRLFARRTFGDRVPFGVVLIVALLLLAPIAYYLWASPTGSLKRDHAAPPAPPAPQVVPRP